jgi:hypothetical protein
MFTAGPCRLCARNRQHEQAEQQRAREPVGERRGRAVDEIARPDEAQERDHGERHGHGGQRTLMFERAPVEAIAQTGVGRVLR